MSGYTARFDWYSATFEQLDDGRVPASLAVALGGTVSWGRGRLGYARCATIESGDETLARVFVGSARLGEVHVAVSGDACDRVVPLVRRLWPEHRVARADSAIDFKSEFEVIDAAALEFAKDRRLAFRLVTDSEGGATRYLGSPALRGTSVLRRPRSLSACTRSPSSCGRCTLRGHRRSLTALCALSCRPGPARALRPLWRR